MFSSADNSDAFYFTLNLYLNKKYCFDRVISFCAEIQIYFNTKLRHNKSHCFFSRTPFPFCWFLFFVLLSVSSLQLLRASQWIIKTTASWRMENISATSRAVFTTAGSPGSTGKTGCWRCSWPDSTPSRRRKFNDVQWKLFLFHSVIKVLPSIRLN